MKVLISPPPHEHLLYSLSFSLIVFFSLNLMSIKLWKTFYPIELSWHPCQKSVDYKQKIYFQTLSSIPFICMSVFMFLPHCLNYYGFVISFEIGKCECFNFALFQDYFLFIQNPLHFHMIFRSGLSVYAQREKSQQDCFKSVP